MTVQQKLNAAQLSTLAQAMDYASKLSGGAIVVGGGILAPVARTPDMQDGDPDYTNSQSGIYLEPWVNAGSQTPPGKIADGDVYFPFQFRFKNGAAGMNVGLIIDKFRRYPTAPSYVMGTLAAEAASMAITD